MEDAGLAEVPIRALCNRYDPLHEDVEDKGDDECRTPRPAPLIVGEALRVALLRKSSRGDRKFESRERRDHPPG